MMTEQARLVSDRSRTLKFAVAQHTLWAETLDERRVLQAKLASVGLKSAKLNARIAECLDRSSFWRRAALDLAVKV